MHGLSIPGLNLIFKFCGVKPIMDDAVVVRCKAVRVPTPANAEVNDNKTFVAYNRFSRPLFEPGELPIVEGRYSGHMHHDGGRAATPDSVELGKEMSSGSQSNRAIRFSQNRF